jgi:hypothetical protein
MSTLAHRAYQARLERLAAGLLQGFAASGKIAAEIERAEFTEPEDTKPAAVFSVECHWASRAVELAKSLIIELDAEEQRQRQHDTYGEAGSWP